MALLRAFPAAEHQEPLDGLHPTTRRRHLGRPGEPIMLTLYGPDSEVAVPLLEDALKQKFAFKKEIW